MDGAVDHRGAPADRSTSGGWTAALFIIGVEVGERAAYYGFSLNLITYMTGSLHQSTPSAAAAINAWSGVASMLPLLGAFIADSYLGRYRMIVVASVVYVLGLGMLTLSSMLTNLGHHIQVALVYSSLYLIAFGQGGYKPCMQAFGGDQFDENDLEEAAARSSFFNWWFFGMNIGIIASLLSMSYVQEHISWGLGFGIPCGLMAIAVVIFVMGTRTYRYYKLEGENPFGRIGRAFAALAKSWRASLCKPELQKHGDANTDELIEEAKEVLRLFPIWGSCLIYATVYAQSATLFTKQGSTLDIRIGSIQVPPATLQGFISISILTFVPVYDRILVPTARKFSGLPSGITVLQRVGTGMFVSMMSMTAAALVEMKRLRTARDHGLLDLLKSHIPMSVWWLVPQYVLMGIAHSFTLIGLQEFFYDQVPSKLRSLGLALYLCVFGVGNFISTFLVSVIDKSTGRRGEGWFSDNLNRAHLDYFYWLLAGLSALGLLAYLFLAQAYVYRRKQTSSV